MMSATHYFGDIDVICDIGGQDIKVLFMQNGDIKNFRLSNQCSAGNGMLLQAMADQFGVQGHRLRRRRVRGRAVAQVQLRLRRVPRLATASTSRRRATRRRSCSPGLAQVLPKNVWQYVVQIPRMAELGKKFVLQGGTQHNLAALKAQVDYIKERVPGAEVYVHPHMRRGRRDRRGVGDAARGQAHAATRRSSASTPRSTSSSRRPTTRRRAATSARTTARARSSTPRRPTARPPATSRASPARRAPSSRKTR